jgi:mycothiol synthase
LIRAGGGSRLLGMTEPSLPPGYRLSRPDLDSAAEIYDLVAAVDTAVLGRPDVTPDDVADELVEPGFEPATDGWLVHDPDGRLVAWAWACGKGDSENVDVAVITPAGEGEVAAYLWPLVQRRAVEIAGGLGYDRVVIDAGAYRDDKHRRRQLVSHGFEHAATFQRLRIDHDGPRPQPNRPPGVVVRDGSAGQEVLRVGHAVRNEAFSEHFGFVANDYADWLARMQASSANDWSQLRVAFVRGEPAAMLLGTNSFAEDENCGYVRTLGVRKKFRGLGLARYLLRLAFATDAANGRFGTYLHVDSVGAPAVALYTSEGMRPTLVMDVWRRTLSTRRIGVTAVAGPPRRR